MPSQVVDAAKELIEKRITDLDDERVRLERALKELGGKARRRRGRPAGGGKPKRKKRQRRKGGTRADQALGVITKSPGLAANEVATQMKIKPNYVYRVLGDLEKEGRVKKDGRQYFPAARPAKSGSKA